MGSCRFVCKPRDMEQGRRLLQIGSLRVWLISAAVFSVGCSGGVSQDDMRAHALKRSSSKSVTPAVGTSDEIDTGPVIGDVTMTQPAENELHGRDAERKTTSPDTCEQPPGTSASANGVHFGQQVAELLRPASDQACQKTSDPTEQRRRTIANLTRIGSALNEYTRKNKRLFAPYIYDLRRNRPLLSWRVHLLPYLGYQKLYDQFHLDEPWDSQHNAQLLKKIPAEYQAPERCDTNTNYLVPEGSTTAFRGRVGMRLGRIDDGVGDTVAVVEVDAEHAVPWTQPAELKIDLHASGKHVGNLRHDGFFVVWCDGEVSLVAKDATPTDLVAIWTADAGDAAVFARTHVKPTTDVAAAESAVGERIDEDADEAVTDSHVRTDDAVPRRVLHLSESKHGNEMATDREQRFPVPDASELAKVRKTAKQIYRADHDSGNDLAARRSLAKRLLQNAVRLNEDPAGMYVVCEIAMRIAVQTGDSVTAIAAADHLANHFTVDVLELKCDLLQKLAKTDRTRVGMVCQMEQAEGLIAEAMKREAYETANSVCQLALTAATKLGEHRQAAGFRITRKHIGDAQVALARMRRVLGTTATNGGSDANRIAGVYYCFFRGNWERGLRLLAKGSDAQLAQVAKMELRRPATPTEQARLGDDWWALAAKMPHQRRELQSHAAEWYVLALAGLPDGLTKLKVEMRLKQIESLRAGRIANQSDGNPTLQ